MNCLFLFLGIVVFNLLRLIVALKKKGATWNTKKFVIDNGLPSLVSVIFGISLILSKSISIEYIPITISIITINVSVYLLIGVFADVLVKKLFEVSKKK
jgi:hypothetical protein